MWQHVANIILGFVIVCIGFLTSHQFSKGTGWTLVVIGIAIAVIAFWGLADEVSLFSKAHEDSGSDVETDPAVW